MTAALPAPTPAPASAPMAGVPTFRRLAVRGTSRLRALAVAAVIVADVAAAGIGLATHDVHPARPGGSGVVGSAQSSRPTPFDDATRGTGVMTSSGAAPAAPPPSATRPPATRSPAATVSGGALVPVASAGAGTTSGARLTGGASSSAATAAGGSTAAAPRTLTAGHARASSLPPPRNPPPLSTFAVPQRVAVAVITVSTTVSAVSGTASGPPQPAKAAEWLRSSAVPGAPGTAVILGSSTGQFARLATLQTGDEVDVARSDATTAVFRVARVVDYAGAPVPAAALAATAGPTLALVSQGSAAGGDTVVAFTALSSAHLTG